MSSSKPRLSRQNGLKLPHGRGRLLWRPGALVLAYSRPEVELATALSRCMIFKIRQKISARPSSSRPHRVTNPLGPLGLKKKDSFHDMVMTQPVEGRRCSGGQFGVRRGRRLPSVRFLAGTSEDRAQIARRCRGPLYSPDAEGTREPRQPTHAAKVPVGAGSNHEIDARTSDCMRPHG
jgi:hypothetical protein